MSAKVLLLEFNEICPPLLERWLGQGKLSNFRRLFESSDVFVSVADNEANPANLEPWIQWYSIHTGLPYAQHRVFRLTDGPRAAHIDLWRLVQEAGKSPMNCSSMNAKGFKGERAFFLPDPWCAAEAAWPPETEIFARVVSTVVREYTNARIPLSFPDYTRFVQFLIGHGLSTSTVWTTLAQLVAEKGTSRDITWKRASLLDRLQYDVFAYYYRRLSPDFATFFSNSTAHLQHAYWRHMDPDPFTIKPSAAERQAYGDAVFYGYEAMDRLIGRFLGLVDDETVVILCSALSQRPFIQWDGKGGQHFYRLHNVHGFFDLLGTTPAQIEPIMTHQYVVTFSNAETTAEARDRLNAITLEDSQVFWVNKGSETSLEFGCQIYRLVAGDEQLAGFIGRNETVQFKDLLYPINAVKSGFHHPEGVLWIRNGRHAIHSEPVSILDIAPTVCRMLGLDPALVGRAGFHGVDLVDRIAH